ncbi:MAG: hypothetical protein QOI62_1434 [Solirubrobacteraceae bacterium]|jgi:hypothetical protein|nr:hypothetical protein [Solirubrobacteraceae bacterium]MEA2358174.1 hypothetical protein [Solirubrobacteraceae bacterium]
MDTRIQILAIVASGALLFFVLELVRRRRLQERYALLWLASTVCLLVLAIWRDALAKVASLVGIAYPPNALFFLAFAGILVVLLHFSVVISRLSDQSKILAQRLAMLDERLRRQEQADVLEADPVDEPVAGSRFASR